jgi:hypothetical protein
MSPGRTAGSGKPRERAIIVKLADRIANIEHSIINESRILGMYRFEAEEFRKALTVPYTINATLKDVTTIKNMWNWLEMLMKEAETVVI